MLELVNTVMNKRRKNSRIIYLDHNATSIILPEVGHFMLELMNKPLNPSSIHYCGRMAKKLVEEAREQIKLATGATRVTTNNDYNVTFTASGTEANNLIMSNFLDGEIYISAIEHQSILEFAKKCNNVFLVPVDKNGIVKLDALEQLLKQSDNPKKLVSVMLANNESGVIQPIAKISQLARKYNALMHSDCIQALGRIPLDTSKLELDFVTLSGHKCGGPIGAAALLSKKHYRLKPMLIGGGQESYRRAGSENVIAIAGFGLAATLASQNITARFNHLQQLQKKLEDELKLMPLNITIASQAVERLPNTTLIMCDGLDAGTQLIAFDMQEVMVSSGAACSSGTVKSSHVLKAMQVPEDLAKSAIRVSLGHTNTIEDIKDFIKTFQQYAHRK